MNKSQRTHSLAHAAIDAGTAAAFAFFGREGRAAFAWHRHRKHQFLVVTHGLGYVQTSLGVAVLTPWRGLLLPAGTLHETRVESDCRYRSLFFSPDRHGLRTVGVQTVEVTPLLAAMVEHCAGWTEPTRATPESRRFFAALWDVACAGARPFAEADVPGPTSKRWREAVGFVLEHLGEVDLPMLARRMGEPERTFRRRFAAEFGCTWRRYLRAVRVSRALQLLESGQGNVTEAAYAVGFRSLSAFNAAFRAVFGRNPLSVRRRLNAPGRPRS